MSKVQERIDQIKTQKVGATSKRVLIVEGVDDEDGFSQFLNKKFTNWESDWVIASAGNKSGVLKILENEPTWVGVVDRDEWSEETLTQKQSDLANLLVLPRYCFESYLIMPSELWAAFPQKQKDKIAGGEAELTSELHKDLDRWIAHGALWAVVNPLWDGLRAKGFKEELLSPTIALDDEKIQTTLQTWHDHLKPDDIWTRFQATLTAFQAKPLEDQLSHCIHGKAFFDKVVNPTLNALLGQKSAKERKTAITRNLPVPSDLDPLWSAMGLS